MQRIDYDEKDRNLMQVGRLDLNLIVPAKDMVVGGKIYGKRLVVEELQEESLQKSGGCKSKEVRNLLDWGLLDPAESEGRVDQVQG